MASPRPVAGPGTSDRTLGWATLALAAVLVIAACYALQAVIPDNPVHLPLENQRSTELVLPQGWAFFTAGPESVYPQAFRLTGGQWHDQGGSLAMPADLFGLDRDHRAQGTETALLTQDIPASAWRSCSVSPARCLSAAPVSYRVANTSALQDLCGQIGFVRQEVLPWAWHGTGTIMPSKVLRVEVSCDSAR